MPKIKFSAPLASNRANGISKTDNAAPARSANSRRPLCGQDESVSQKPYKKITNMKNYSAKEIKNIVLIGAPGTGKSFTLNREKDTLLAAGGEYERVTFHPD